MFLLIISLKLVDCHLARPCVDEQVVDVGNGAVLEDDVVQLGRNGCLCTAFAGSSF